MVALTKEDVLAALSIPSEFTIPEHVTTVSKDVLAFLRQQPITLITVSPAITSLEFPSQNSLKKTTALLSLHVPENNSLLALSLDGFVEKVTGSLHKLKTLTTTDKHARNLKALPPMPMLEHMTGLSGCQLTSFEVPPLLKTISRYCFAGSSIKNMVVPDSIEKIESSAFAGSKLEHITLPNNTKFETIASDVFENCSFLTTLSIPDSVQIIARTAFRKCGFTKIHFSPNSQLTYIEKRAFESSGLVDFKMPDSVNTVGLAAFSEMEDLKTMTLSKNDEFHTLPEKCFYDTPSLTAMTIPPNIYLIQDDAFSASGVETLIFEEGSQLKYLLPKAFRHSNFAVLDLSMCTHLREVYGFRALIRENQRVKKIYLPHQSRPLFAQLIAHSCHELEEIHLGTWTPKHVNSPFTGEHMCAKLRLLQATSIDQFKPLYYRGGDRDASFNTLLTWTDRPQNLELLFDFADNDIEYLRENYYPDFHRKSKDSAYDYSKLHVHHALQEFGYFRDNMDPEAIKNLAIGFVETKETPFGLARRGKKFKNFALDEENWQIGAFYLVDPQPLVDEPFQTNEPLILTAITGEEFEITDGWKAPNGDIIAAAKRQYPVDLADYDFTLVIDDMPVDPKTFTLHTLAAMCLDNQFEGDFDGKFMIVHADAYEPPDPAPAAGGTKRKRSESLSMAFIDLTL